MLAGQLITMFVLAIALSVTYIILKHNKIEIPSLVYKIVSGVLALTFFFRYMLNGDALTTVFKSTNSPTQSQEST